MKKDNTLSTPTYSWAKEHFHSSDITCIVNVLPSVERVYYHSCSAELVAVTEKVKD